MLSWLIENALMATLLAAVVALLCQLRLRPAVRHALWLLVIVKLVVPPVLHVPWIIPWDSLEESKSLEPIPDMEWVPEEAFLLQGDLLWRELVPGGVELGLANPERSVSEPKSALDVTVYILAIWGGACLGMMLLHGIRLARLRALVKRSTLAPDGLVAEVRELAQHVGVRLPQVLVSEEITTPAICCLHRSLLLWPQGLGERLSEDGRRTAILHELAHVSRGDPWVGWIVLLASCLWWWNPVFRLARRRLEAAAEQACDAWVVAMAPTSRRAYAEALLDVCQWRKRKSALAPALGMGGAKQDLERRLVMILREKTPYRLPLRALGGVILLALLVVPGWSQSAPQAPAVAPVGAAQSGSTRRATVPTPDSAPTSQDQEQRLQKLEASLKELLNELKSIRGSAGATQPATAKRWAGITTGAMNPTTAAAPGAPANPVAQPTPVPYPNPGANPNTTPSLARTVAGSPLAVYQAHSVAGEAPPIALTRVTYKLPKDKADLLMKLLEGLPKPQVLEIKMEDGLVVTTSPDVQAIVGDFVALLSGKVRPGSSHLRTYYIPSGSTVPPVAPPLPSPAK